MGIIDEIVEQQKNFDRAKEILQLLEDCQGHNCSYSIEEVISIAKDFNFDMRQKERERDSGGGRYY